METGWYGGGADSALGDSVMSTDSASDPTSRHRGYSGDDDDDDDVIPDVISGFQVADVTRYFDSLNAQYQRTRGNGASTAANRERHTEILGWAKPSLYLMFPFLPFDNLYSPLNGSNIKLEWFNCLLPLQ